jgi:hypothetical protein
MLKKAILFQLLSVPKDKNPPPKKPESENRSIFTDTAKNISSYVSGLFFNSSKEDDQEKLTEGSKQG